MNVDISSISNYRANYCVSAPLSSCTNCTHTVVNLFLADRRNGRAIGTVLRLSSSSVVCNVMYCG